MTLGQRAWSRSLLSGVVGFLFYLTLVAPLLEVMFEALSGHVSSVWVHLTLGIVAALAVARQAYVHATWGRVCGILGFIVAAWVWFGIAGIRAFAYLPPAPLVYGLGIPLIIALVGFGCLITSKRMPIKRELRRT